MKAVTPLLIYLISAFASSMPAVGQMIYGEIPVPSYRRYHLDASSSNADELFDGKITAPVKLWTGEFADPHYYVINFTKEQEVTLSSLELYDGAGTIADSANYVKFYYKTFTSDQPVYIGSFSGSTYNKWVSLQPSGAPVIRQLLIKKRRNVQLMPNEIRLLGSYKEYTPPAPAFSKAPLADLCGINVFAWNIQKTNTDPNAISTPKLEVLNGYNVVRDFVDWGQLEAVEGEYTMGNTHPGGWKYDSIYTSLKRYGKKVLVSIKNTPSWMFNTYPVGYRKTSNAYLKYKDEFASGTNLFNEKYVAAKKDPASYIEFSKLMYQYAGRYGKNGSIDITTLHQDTRPRWTNDPPNEVKAALALVDGIEVGNEPNKNWHGIEGYMSPEDYAACLSAVYDGHQGRLGPGTGIKNADPAMPVYMGGLATNDPSYIVAMVEWCRQNRGTRPDGSVDICWDVINYHIYSNNKSGLQYDGSSATRVGTSYESSGIYKGVQNFLQVSGEYCANVPVVITETGWDWQTTPQAAKVTGERTVLQTVADWSLRATLLLARSGIQELYFYQAYDDDLTGTSSTQYFTSGHLSRTDDATVAKRPVANFLTALKKQFGHYRFVETISTDPVIDKYSDGVSEMYACWKPSEDGTTTTYNMSLEGADSVFLFRPLDTADRFALSKYPVQGSYDVLCTETPVFLQVKMSTGENPAPPELFADDERDYLEARTTEPNTTIYYSEDGSVFKEYKSRISVKNTARPVGYWKFKTLSNASGRESSVVNSPAFHLKTQRISFKKSAGSVATPGPLDLDATATSGLPVSYRVVSGPGFINENHLIFREEGQVHVEASQPGNEYFAAAKPVVQSFEAKNQKTYGGEDGFHRDTKELLIYPNPINTTATIQVQPGFSGEASIDVFDMLSRQVHNVYSGSVSKGVILQFPFRVHQLKSGLYIVRLQGQNHSVTEKIVISH